MSLSASLSERPPAAIGLFDLDGTLIAWDCQLLFRHFVVRREPWRVIFLPVFLAFVPLAALLGTEAMKRIFLSYLWGIDRATLCRYSRDFAKAVMPAIYSELRERIDVHRQRGDFLILASASPEVYVREIGRELGFDLSLGTPVQWGYLFPDLCNHKGQAKVERLKRLLPPEWWADGRLAGCHGYTDSTADLPMLGLCESVTLVNPSADLTARGEAAGWQVLRPLRPWSSKLGFAGRVLALLLGIGRDPGGLGGASEKSLD